MNLEEMLKAVNAKLEAHNKRLDEIKVELRKADLTDEKFDELNKEMSDIIEARMSEIKEREELIAKIEARKKEEEAIAKAQMAKKENEENNNMFVNKRDAYALLIGKAMKKTPLNDEEKRALDKSLGTTATQYVVPTANADGVSNFGVFIQTKVLTDLLEEDRDMSPVLRDAILYRVKGLTEFPYRKSRTTANKKVEGKAVADATWEFATVEGKKGYLQSILNITDEVLSLSDVDLGQYVISLMMEDMREDFATELIYGDGTVASGNTPARIAGISHGATTITANKATIFEDLANAYTALPKRYKKGAQFYVSQEVYEMLKLAKDSAGHYIFDVKVDAPITILGRPVEVEPNLATNSVLIGNIRKYYKGNLLKDVTLEQDKTITTQIHTFVASAFACCAPVPGAFAYGVVNTTATSSTTSH